MSAARAGLTADRLRIEGGGATCATVLPRPAHGYVYGLSDPRLRPIAPEIPDWPVNRQAR